MSKIKSGLQSALVAERKKRQQLEVEKALMLPVFQNNIWEVVKKDFPSPNKKVQELADNAYWIDGATPNVLTAIAYDNFPGDSFDTLVESIEGIDRRLADGIKENFNFTVLGKGESYRASGFVNTDSIAVDTEEWWSDLPKDLKNWDEDEEKADKIRDAIEQFKSDLIDEIQSYIKDIENELNHYLLDDDFFKKPIFIKEVDEDGLIVTDHRLIGWRSDDETEWEFINKYRKQGSLIGVSQIANPELLPDFLQDEKIFVIHQ